MMKPKEYCQALRSKILSGDVADEEDLKIRILDFLIEKEIDLDRFERLLRARIDDPDPAKEKSKSVCSQILDGWKLLK